MTSDLLSQAELILPPTRLLIGGWMILTAAQWLASAGVFAPDGIIPWQLLATQKRRRVLAVARRRMSVPLLRTILILQIAAAALLAGVGQTAMTIACLSFLIAMHAASILLSGDFWANGATKMGMIAMIGALLVAIGLRQAAPALVLAGILVAGGQLVLCYAVAGFSKLATPAWRNATAFQDAMDCDSWGHPLAARLVAQRGIAITASWTVMLAEALFPLALMAPTPWLIGALGVMLVFHLATAAVMGLNLFPWAFAATYPAVIALSWAVRAAT